MHPTCARRCSVASDMSVKGRLAHWSLSRSSGCLRAGLQHVYSSRRCGRVRCSSIVIDHLNRAPNLLYRFHQPHASRPCANPAVPPDLAPHTAAIGCPKKVRGSPNTVQMLGMCNTTVVTEAFAMDIQSAMKKRTRTLPVRSAVSMSLDSARGLQALHEASIVHYDIKPAQMLVTDDGVDGGELRVKLNDFNVVFFMSSLPDGTPCPFTLPGELQLGPWRTPEYLAKKVRDDDDLRFCSQATLLLFQLAILPSRLNRMRPRQHLHIYLLRV